MPENIPTSPASSVAAAPGASNAPEDPAKRALQALLPEFYAAVGEFEDLKAAPGLSPEAVAALEKKLEFGFPWNSGNCSRAAPPFPWRACP